MATVVFGLAVACSSDPMPAATSPTTTAWTPAPLPVASTSAAASASAPVVVDAPPSVEPYIKIHKSFSPTPGRGASKGTVFYLSDDSGSPQLYSTPAGGPASAAGDAKPTQLTRGTERVSAYRISPDGTGAIVMRDHGGDENDQLLWVDLKAAASDAYTPTKLTDSPKVKHTAPAFDTSGKRIAFTSTARNGKDMDLYVETLPKAGATSTPLPSKPLLEITGAAFVSDFRGETVLLQEARSNVDFDLWAVDVRTKKKRLLTQHAGDVRFENALLSSDGRSVYALSDEGREYVALVSIDVATGKRKELYAVDHDVSAFTLTRTRVPKVVAKGARAVERGLLVVNVDGVNEVRSLVIDNAGGHGNEATVGAPIDVHGVVSGVEVDEDGLTASLSIERAELPAEIFGLDVRSGVVTRLTHSDHAGLDESTFVAAERLTMKSFDGTPVQLFWLAKPAVAGVKRPVIIAVHGGPEAQAQPTFSGFLQALVARGYDVAIPNVRGSMGYGKAFSHLDDKAKREDSVHDLSEVGKFIAARTDVDATRIALYGGSYGGYMVLAGLTLYPTQWAAGVDVVGISNFRTFLEKTSAYRRAIREAEYGALATDGDLLDRISPIHRVEAIAAPLMMVHGTNDPRVPVGETKQIEAALLARKLPVETMIFDDEGHGVVKLKNKLVAYPAIAAFFDKYVRLRAPTTR